MSLALPLFDTAPVSQPPVRPVRRFVASTSRKAYDELQPSLSGREAFVLQELRAYERLSAAPTAYELIEFARGRWPERRIDVNTIRPRLTALAKAVDERGHAKRVYVAKVEKRACAVTGQTAWTWRVL